MGFNSAMLRGILKMVPQSVIDGVPELIVNTVNQRILATKVNEGENAAVMIFPDDPDSHISIVAIDTDDNIRVVENYSGREFIKSLLKEADNG